MGEAGSFTCQTAPGQLFATVDELKAHYKTDWHRYNLKRKVVGLPMVGRDLFERVVSHAINAEEAAVDRATSTAHLKADKQRRPPRSRQLALEDDNSDSEDDDDWEEVHGDEAEQVIQQLQQRRGARGDQAAPMADDCSSESSDTEMGDRELSADTHIALAGNGVELVVGRHILGAREFSRYYRQRPRPSDNRAMTLAATASSREQALVLGKAANIPSHKGAAVSKQHARHQREEQRTGARLRLITEMNANGPQFRGFRDG